MGITQVIAAVIQLFILILKNKFEKDAEVRKKKDELHAEASKAIKDRDVSSLNLILNQLRDK